MQFFDQQLQFIRDRIVALLLQNVMLGQWFDIDAEIESLIINRLILPANPGLPKREVNRLFPGVRFIVLNTLIQDGVVETAEIRGKLHAKLLRMP